MEDVFEELESAAWMICSAAFVVGDGEAGFFEIFTAVIANARTRVQAVAPQIIVLRFMIYGSRLRVHGSRFFPFMV